jgi:uracil-DNA glycosylase family 4
MAEISWSLAKAARRRCWRSSVKVRAQMKIAVASPSSVPLASCLSKMIKAMGEHALKLGLPDLGARLSREQVYIGNVVKCRPPGNRVPEPDEIAACGEFISAQLRATQPQVIVALGRTPTQFLLENSAPLGRLRGQFGDWQGVPVMPTYHPAYLLRTPSAKAQVWEDLKLVINRLAELSSAASARPASPV